MSLVGSSVSSTEQGAHGALIFGAEAAAAVVGALAALRRCLCLAECHNKQPISAA